MPDRVYEFRPRKTTSGLRARALDRIDLGDLDAEPEPRPAHPQPVDYREESAADALARLRRDTLAISSWLSGCDLGHVGVDAAGALRGLVAGNALPQHIAADLQSRARLVEDRRAAEQRSKGKRP